MLSRHNSGSKPSYRSFSQYLTACKARVSALQAPGEVKRARSRALTPSKQRSTQSAPASGRRWNPAPMQAGHCPKVAK
jgi:hypothetical protein